MLHTINSRNRTILISIAFLAIIIFLYNIYIKQSIKVLNVDASYRHYQTFKDLNKDAQLILLGTPTQEFEDRKHINTYFESGDLEDSYTLTEFKIEKILKQPKDFNLDPSGKITFVEGIGLIETPQGKRKLTVDGYTELKKDSKYVVFLKKNTFGQYGLIFYGLGKYNIDNTDKDDLNIEDKDKKIKFKNELITEYGL